MMINRPIVFSVKARELVDTFNGKATHWDGTCTVRKSFRKEVRNYYRDAQKMTCPYCGRLRQDFHGGQWDIDHIIPKSSHPEYLYTPQNLAVTCKDCNTHKSDKNPLSSTLEQVGPYPNAKENYKIIHPHFDNYHEHIELTRDNEGYSYHRIISEKGRETFQMCHLIRFSEALSGTSEFVAELKTDVGIFDDFSEPVQMWLESFDTFNPEEAEMALQVLMNKISQRKS